MDGMRTSELARTEVSFRVSLAARNEPASLAGTFESLKQDSASGHTFNYWHSTLSSALQGIIRNY